MLSPVSSSRCICNFIPNGETSLITCSLSAGRSVTRTKGPHLPPERLRGTAGFLGFNSPALAELCPTLPQPPHAHRCPGKLRPEGLWMLSLSIHGHVTAPVAFPWWHLAWGGFGTFPRGQSQPCHGPRLLQTVPCPCWASLWGLLGDTITFEDPCGPRCSPCCWSIWGVHRVPGSQT